MEIEQRKVIIVAESSKEAHKIAERSHLNTYYWISDFRRIDDWGKVSGYNKANCVLWLGNGFYNHPDYLLIQHLMYTFEIPVVDKTTEPLNPFLLPLGETIH